MLPMDPQSPCQCSIDTLQMMAEFRNVHTVVDLRTILDLVHRVCRHGQAMTNCDSCNKNPQSSIVTLPALAEQCLSLFDAVCSAYGIKRNVLFDPAVLAFEQPLPQFICIKSRTILGQMELDDEEAGLLIKMLLNRSLVRLLELLEVLKGILRARLKDVSHPRVGAATFRACESSVESTIHRLAVFMEQVEVESGKNVEPLQINLISAVN